MLRERIDARGQTQRLVFRHGALRNDVRERRTPMGQGSGLVQGHRLQVPALFEYSPPLTRMPRRAAAPGHDDRDRRGDHERTGAGDDQHHQRLVDPFEPGLPESERRNDRHGQCHRKHRGRVDAGELVHEALRGRALSLRSWTDRAMRSSVVSPLREVTRNSNVPRSLMVPANTVAPVVFSTGMLSPVIGAWFTDDWPATTSPSSAMRSPDARARRFKGYRIRLDFAPLPVGLAHQGSRARGPSACGSHCGPGPGSRPRSSRRCQRAR